MSTWDESSQTLEPLIPLHHPSSLGIDSISLRTNFQCKGFVMVCYIVFTPWISLDTVFLEKGHHGDGPSPTRQRSGRSELYNVVQCCTWDPYAPIYGIFLVYLQHLAICCFDLWRFSNHGQVGSPVISRIPFGQGALHASPAMLEEVQNILNKA